MAAHQLQSKSSDSSAKIFTLALHRDRRVEPHTLARLQTVPEFFAARLQHKVRPRSHFHVDDTVGLHDKVRSAQGRAEGSHGRRALACPVIKMSVVGEAQPSV